MAETLCSEL